LPLHAGEKVLPPATVVAPPTSDWSFFVTLPGWAAGLSGDVGVAGYNPVAVDMGFLDILEDLDMAAMLTLEARHRRWGVIFDGIYMDMGTSGATPGGLLTSVDVQVEQVLAEVDLAYRLLEGKRGYLDVFVGARYVYMGTEINFHLDNAGVREISNELSDAIVNRAVTVLEKEVRKTAARIESQLAALELPERADALRQEVRTAAAEKILEENALREIIRALHGLTPAERQLLVQKIESSKDIIAANKALAKAVVQERAAAEVASVRRKAQQAVVRAKKKLANSIEAAIKRTVPEQVSGSESWIDPLVGFRGRLNLTDKFYLAARGDIGGFGVGSELAWNVFGSLGYQWTERFSTELGYRHLSMDYNNNGFIFDADMSGLFLGMTLKL
jgi:hypothetical protein